MSVSLLASRQNSTEDSLPGTNDAIVTFTTLTSSYIVDVQAGTVVRLPGLGTASDLKSPQFGHDVQPRNLVSLDRLRVGEPAAMTLHSNEGASEQWETTPVQAVSSPSRIAIT